MTKDRLLVTGGTGFVGRHILPLVRGSFEIHVAIRHKTETADDLVQHAVDLRDPEACCKLIEAVHPSHLLHLAWSTEHGHFWSDPANVDWLVGSIALMRAFSENGGQRALLIGTCAEYEPHQELCSEISTRLAPSSLYGSMKLALFQAATSIAAAHGTSFAWARIFHPFGAGEDSRRLVPTVVAAALSGEAFIAKNPSLTLDFIDVRDLADALHALLLSNVQGAINLGSGESVEIGSLVSLVYELAGKTPPLQPEMTKSALLPDLTRQRLELCFAPCIGLRQGLLDCLAAGEPPARLNKELT